MSADRNRPKALLPKWERVLVVVAHPDDESFGLGGVIGEFTKAGAEVTVHCFSQGEASTLHAGEGELRSIRSAELAAAAEILGVTRVELSDFPDGGLESILPKLVDAVTAAVATHQPDGLLIFHRDGVTGHPDHVAAGVAAVEVATGHALPVLEWTLPTDVAGTMSEETGGSFTGYPLTTIDVAVPVDRELHHRAIAAHPSQAVQDSPLWRRLELLGEHEYLQLTQPQGSGRKTRSC